MNGHGIGWAVKMMKVGRRVCRSAWNGRGMFIYLNKSFFNDDLDATDGERRHCEPCIVMYTAQDKHQPGWLASQPDLLATDWMLADCFSNEYAEIAERLTAVSEPRVIELIQAHAGHRVGPMGPKGDRGEPGLSGAQVRDIVREYIEGCEIEVTHPGVGSSMHNVIVIHPRPERYEP